MSPHRIPELENRVGTLEERMEQAAQARAEIEERLIKKLTAIERVGLAQVSAIESLTEELQRQAKRNELQDQDLERLKQTVHGWVGEKLSSPSAVGGVAGLTTATTILIEVVSRVWGLGQ